MSPAVNSCKNVGTLFDPMKPGLRKHLHGIFLHLLSKDLWTPDFGKLSRAVSTGGTTFYEFIDFKIL